MYPWLTPVYARLVERLTNAQLHHGLLLHGHDGIGKTAFSLALAKRLLCQQANALESCGRCQACLLFNAESHPDLHQIDAEKQIGVDLIRAAISKLSATAQLSGNKVLIIHGAERMTESASNALLKTLEEPTAKTYILLISTNPERLLPTIHSRCEKHLLNAPDVNACMQWLQSQGIENIDDTLVRLFQCAPLRIQRYLEDDNAMSVSDFHDTLQQLKDKQTDSVSLAGKWQDHLELVIDWMQHFTLENIKQTGTNVDSAMSFTGQCRLASQASKQVGVNRSLILAGVLDHYVLTNPF